MTELTTKIKPFLIRNVHSATKAGECREVVLRHYSLAGKKSTSEVRHWDIEDHHKNRDSFDALVNEVETTAIAEAAALKGVQSYVLTAFHGKNERPTERLIFRVDGEEEESDDLESEPATPKGILAQQMRHNEVIMKTAMMGTGTTIQMLQRLVAKQAEQIDNLEGERMKNMQLFIETATAQHEREVEKMRISQRDEMVKQLMGKVSTLLPIVANKIAGRELMPAPVKEAMSGFFETLTPEQKMTIFGALNDEQKAVMAEIFAVMQN